MRIRGLSSACALILLVGACSSSAPPETEASSTATTPPASVSTAPSPSAVPDGWVVHEAEGFTIAAPASWEEDIPARDGGDFLLNLYDPQGPVGLSVSAHPPYDATPEGARAFADGLTTDTKKKPFVNAPDEITAGPVQVVVGREKMGTTVILFPSVLVPGDPVSYRLSFVQGASADFGPEEMLQIANTFTLTNSPAD